MATIKQIKDTNGNIHDILSTIGYGTCATAAATAAKVATISDTSWTLKVGSIIGIKFTNSNSAGSSTTPVTLNVNSTGAKNIWYNNEKYTGKNTSVCGYANRVLFYMYDGTHWVWMNMGSLDDTKTSTSEKASTKLFLVGATKQSTSGQTTYSNSKCYVGTDNCLYSNGTKVLTSYSDDKVTSEGNHYTPTTNTSSTLSVDASGGTAAWSKQVVTGVNIERDSKGHITGLSVDSAAIPANPNTDTKVTSVGNHYTPTAETGSELTASLSGTAGSYAKDTEYTVLTGVKAQRDSKGHVTGITYTAQKIKDTDTTYSSLKNPNAIKFKNTSGTDVTYDGSSAADLSGGVYYAATAGSATNATNATNATKSTQDGSGNTITSTYSKLAGNNTFTGTNTFSKIILNSASDSYIEYTNEKLCINSDELVKITSDLEVTGLIDGTATKADALTSTSKGSATQPVYFDANGKPVACTYTLDKSVPSDAKFTDTVYIHPIAAGNKHIPSGGSSGQVLKYSSSGTATWATLTADDVGASASGHNHDDRYPSNSDFEGFTSYVESDFVKKTGSLKNPNAIKFKNALGKVVTYDGSSAADLSLGVYNATTATTATTATNASNVNVNINNTTGNLPILFTTRTSNASATESASNRKVYIDSEKDKFYYNPSTNQVTCAGGFFETSDERLKDIVNPITVDLDKLSKLRKVYFNWKDKPDSDLQLGMIAQDVQELYPELVSESNGQLSLSYEKLSVVALEAIDVLHNENNELKSRIERLESLVNQLAEKVND